MVDKVLPGVGPDAVVPLPIRVVAAAHRQPRGGGQTFGLHPEVFVAVADRAVWRKSIDQATVDSVPAALHRGVEQMTRCFVKPGRRGIADAPFQLQQQLGPFGQMAGLEPPRAKNIAFVMAVVIPVGRPVGVVVLPDQTIGQRCLAAGDGMSQGQRAVEIALFAGGGVRSQHRLAGVHVRVLAAVGAELPIGRGFVGVERVGRLPKAAFHQLESLGDAFARARHASLGGMGMSQQHEGQAVAVVAAVLHGGAAVVPVDLPGVALLRLGMHLAHKGQGMGHIGHRFAEPAPGQRLVEDEARAADEVAGAAVVDAAVVLEEVEVAAGRVACAGGVKVQRVAHVGQQHVGVSQVRNGGHGSTLSRRNFSSSSAIWAWTSMRGWAQAKASKR